MEEVKINKVKRKTTCSEKNYRKKRLRVVFQLDSSHFFGPTDGRPSDFKPLGASKMCFSPQLALAKLLFIFCCLGCVIFLAS